MQAFFGLVTQSFSPTNNVCRGGRLHDKLKERLRKRLTVLLMVIELSRKCSE